MVSFLRICLLKLLELLFNWVYICVYFYLFILLKEELNANLQNVTNWKAYMHPHLIIQYK